MRLQWTRSENTLIQPHRRTNFGCDDRADSLKKIKINSDSRTTVRSAPSRKNLLLHNMRVPKSRRTRPPSLLEKLPRSATTWRTPLVNWPWTALESPPLSALHHEMKEPSFFTAANAQSAAAPQSPVPVPRARRFPTT